MKIYAKTYTTLHQSNDFYSEYGGYHEILICNHSHPAGKNVSHDRVVFSESKEAIEKLTGERYSDMIEVVLPENINIYHDKKWWKTEIEKTKEE